MFRQLLFYQLLIVTVSVNCHNLNNNLHVETESGPVRGVALKTLVKNKNYIAYRGIPFAEPPVGELRYRVPVPIAPWTETLQATQYGNSCLVIDQSVFLPWNSTQSEDCLYLNVFRPVTETKNHASKKAVMFFIFGGGFTEGDGTNAFYGPDFFVEEDVILVTFNYRLGPWGFANFELEGYTGNMGFKDQQLALEWVKRNIKYFGGDPNLITIFGESAGGTAVHLHMLNERSRKSMRRAIPMSGTGVATYAHYDANNHIELYKETFGLDPQATGEDVLEFMLNAPVEVILEKTPVVNMDRNLIKIYHTAVYEDETKAENPFLTRSVQEVYKNTRFHVDAMLGVTSAEGMFYLNDADRYDWIEPMKNYSNIGLPFLGLTLSPESFEYQEAIRKIYRFYFRTEELQPTVENLNNYVRMLTDMHFYFPAHIVLRLQSAQAATYCYRNEIVLNLNAIKITKNCQDLYGTAHFEDLLYIFRSLKYESFYDNVLANPCDLTNSKTIEAFRFVTKMFADYAKTGSPGSFGKFTQKHNNVVSITNNGLKPMLGLRTEAMKFWDEIYDSVKPWIDHPF